MDENRFVIGLGNRTVEYAQAVLRRALQFAVEWEILDRNPAAARFRAAQRKRAVTTSATRIRFLDPDETRKFLDVIQDDRHEALYAFRPSQKSRRTVDFPEFVRDVLVEERRCLMELQALAETRWQDNGLVFPPEIGTPLEERNVLRTPTPLYSFTRVFIQRESQSASATHQSN